jgi:hypothetical protein
MLNAQLAFATGILAQSLTLDWALAIGHWHWVQYSPILGPTVREVFTTADDSGRSRRTETPRAASARRAGAAITALPRRVDAHERHGGCDAAHDRSDAAP